MKIEVVKCPVCNENCFVELSKIQFHLRIENPFTLCSGSNRIISKDLPRVASWEE